MKRNCARIAARRRAVGRDSERQGLAHLRQQQSLHSCRSGGQAAGRAADYHRCPAEYQDQPDRQSAAGDIGELRHGQSRGKAIEIQCDVARAGRGQRHWHGCRHRRRQQHLDEAVMALVQGGIDVAAVARVWRRAVHRLESDRLHGQQVGAIGRSGRRTRNTGADRHQIGPGDGDRRGQSHGTAIQRDAGAGQHRDRRQCRSAGRRPMCRLESTTPAPCAAPSSSRRWSRYWPCSRNSALPRLRRGK